MKIYFLNFLGFDGDKCQHLTTFSLSGNSSSTSYIKVASDRPDEYELTLRFKTSLSNGLIAYGSSRPDSDRPDEFYFFSLGLTDGSLSLTSNISPAVKNLGYDLNNTEWQSVYISINSSTITLGRALPDITSVSEVRKIFKIRTVETGCFPSRKPDF